MNTILEQINITGQRFIEYTFTVFVQSSLLIVILLLLDLLLRKKVRAVFRYWIWMLVLLKLVLPASLSTPVSLGQWFGDKLAYVGISRIAPKIEAIGPAPAAVSPAIIDTSHIETSGDRLSFTSIAPEIEPLLVEPATASITPLSWQGAVFLLWLAVVIAMGILLLHRTVFVRRLIRQAYDANNLMNESLEYCRKRMGIRRNVILRVSENTASPAVCGLFRPVILLPRSLGPTLGSSHLRTVLMHELAHIKRGDLWINTFQTALQIFYFYNPLFWLANAMIRRVREQAVDEAVLVALGSAAQQYPETLLNVARLAWQRPALSLRLIGVIESKSQLKERIRKMLEKPVPKSAKLGITGMLAVFALGVFLLPMARADNNTSGTPAASEQSLKDKEAETKTPEEQAAQRESKEQAKTRAKELLKTIGKNISGADKINVSMLTPPMPPKPPEVKQLLPPEFASMPMPTIGPPKEAIQRFQKILAKRDSLEQEINKLQEELEQKLQAGDISDQEAKELNNKIEAMEEKLEQASDQSEECIEQIEEWAEEFAEGMEEWSEEIEEQLEEKYEDKYEREFEQFEEKIEQWAEHFEEQIEQWAEQLDSKLELSFESLEDNLDVLDDAMDEITGNSGDGKVTFRKDPNDIVVPLAEGKRLVVNNNVGSIKIGIGKAGQCKCTYIIKAKAETLDQAKRKAEQIKIEVDDNSDALTLNVTKLDNKWNNINVDLDIQIPQNTDITVTNNVGNIRITDLKGKIECTTDVGDITASNIQGDIKLRTDVGKVNCDIPDDISAKVIASTDVGSIKTVLPLEVTKSNFIGGKASGVLGKGDNKVELRTNVGSITIR
jgi:beta-lactamase regulating signal transducer with metallopeptidase domain